MMFGASMTLLLVLAGVLQSLVPGVVWLGQAKAPFLLAVASYYAVAHGRAAALIAAALAGLLQDSLSLLPMGDSSLCLAVLALAIESQRGFWVRESSGTAAVVGLAGGVLMTWALYGLLVMDGEYAAVAAADVARKAFGIAGLGALVTPAVWTLAAGLERRLDLRPAQGGREAHGQAS